MVRDLDLKKPPSIAESIDWARALLLLGAEDIDARMFSDTMSVIVKHRTDLDIVAERVGVQAGGPPAPEPGPQGFAGRRIARARRGAARRGRRRSGTSRAARRVRGARARSAWTEPDDFREALAATLAKSPDDRRVFELVFDRFFFRAAEAGGGREGVRRGRRRRRRGRRRGRASTSTRCASRSPRRCATATRARCATSRGWRSPPSAARARARASSASTCSASAARSACAPSPSRTCRPSDPRREACRASSCGASRRCCAASSSARRSSAPSSCRPRAPLNELDRALPSGPLQDLAAVHRVVAQLKRRLKTQGQEQPRPAAPRPRRRAPHDARLAGDRRRAGRASSTKPVRPRRPEIFVLCDVSTSVDERVGVLPVASCTRCTTRSARCARSSSSSGSARSPTSSSASATSRAVVARRSARDAGVADISGYTDYGRVWTEFRAARRGRPAPARDGDRARRRAHERPRPARRRLRRRSPRRPGRTFWLNPEPRLYWNYGDSVISAYERALPAFECWTTQQLEDFVKALEPGTAALHGAAATRHQRPASDKPGGLAGSRLR